jgi:demethylmenaquinone methyltransferase/2-methoxy-6-polyprenyl-1,4-benzoquinol methylase
MSQARALLLHNQLTRPAILDAIRAVDFPKGSRGLDAGCGLGMHTRWLSEAVSPDGTVTGLDQSHEHLRLATEDAPANTLFKPGDLFHLPFPDNEFDWSWSADCLWAGPKEEGFGCEDPVPLLRELSRVVRTGGTVVILFTSAKALLPGYPALEAQLDTASAVSYPFLKGADPRIHLMRTLEWMNDVGLHDLKARSFIANIQGPLDEETIKAVSSYFPMYWDRAKTEVKSEVWREYERLCRPDSPDFILNLRDFYGFLTITAFWGTVMG